MKRIAILLLLATAPSLLTAQYRVTQTFAIGAFGGWDYLTSDPATHRLFIARQNRIIVVDDRDGTLLGEVQGLRGAHGTALVPGSGRGYSTSGGDSSVYAFDLRTYAVLARIPAGDGVEAIIYDSTSNRVIAFNSRGRSATVIDGGTGSVVGTVPLGGEPQHATPSGDGKVFVNIEDTNVVAEIDVKSLTVTRRWSTAPCVTPVAIAIDRKNRRLFSGCRSRVMAVSDIAEGKVIATASIGGGVDGAAFDSITGDLFFANTDGTLTIIQQDTPDRYRVVQNLSTLERGRNMALNALTHRVFVAGARFGPAPAESTAANPRRLPPMLPNSFTLLVVERVP